MDKYIENWKDIPGYEGLYQVSDMGNVRSLDRIVVSSDGRVRKLKGYIIKQSIGSTGYYYINLHNKKRKLFKVHKLVAITFLNHIPCGFILVVDHINNNKLDNRLENLQIISNRENSTKDRKGGTSQYVGVSLDRSRNKWISYITIDGKRKYLGRYDSEYDAHISYQRELDKLI